MDDGEEEVRLCGPPLLRGVPGELEDVVAHELGCHRLADAVYVGDERLVLDEFAIAPLGFGRKQSSLTQAVREVLDSSVLSCARS